MKVRPGSGIVKLETQSETVTSIPDGFRLKQPEFDPVDETVIFEIQVSYVIQYSGPSASPMV